MFPPKDFVRQGPPVGVRDLHLDRDLVVHQPDQPGRLDTHGPFEVGTNQPTRVEFQAPGPSQAASTPVVIRYTLTDAESEPANITVEFSTDQATFAPATEASGAYSQGTAALETGPSRQA